MRQPVWPQRLSSTGWFMVEAAVHPAMPRGPMYEEIRTSIDEVLTGPLFKALRAVDCEVPPYDAPPIPSERAFRAKVRIGYVAGTPEARSSWKV